MGLSIQASHLLVEDLQKQILNTLRSSDVIELLRMYYDALLEYVSYQNDEVFAYLTFLYKGDQHKIKMIEFFSCDIKELKLKIIDFMDQYPCQQPVKLQGFFPKDFVALSDSITLRLQIEKESLIPLMDVTS